jgi:hypothetical protein
MVIKIPTDEWSFISAFMKLNILRLAFNASFERKKKLNHRYTYTIIRTKISLT